MFYECVREGLDDVLYVYVINDEVNNYNFKMLCNSCDNFVEINV